MKYIIYLLFVFAFQQVWAQQADEEAIKKTIVSAYVEGIHNRGNVEDIRRGFHPSFHMLRLMENDIRPLSIEEWITNLEKAKQENSATPSRAEAKFISVDVTGNAASVELELYREGKRLFTDYLLLYKFNEGWRIVSKAFYRHP